MPPLNFDLATAVALPPHISAAAAAAPSNNLREIISASPPLNSFRTPRRIATALHDREACVTEVLVTLSPP
jgi:hypothetical protein